MLGSSSIVVLALALPAALGLQVKTEASFGLDQSLDGLPQKMAKIWASAAAGKMTDEMVDTGLQEFFDKQRSLPKEKQMRLTSVVQDMFPEDAVDLEELVDFKYTPLGQSLLQVSEDQRGLLNVRGAATEPKGPMDDMGKNWYPYYDDWKERGEKKPEMRGPYEYNPEETKLDKNLRLSEEEIAKDNCIPDDSLYCTTKDITYLPCRQYNLCMALFNEQASKFNFYAPRGRDMPKAVGEMQKARQLVQQGQGVCNALNAATAAQMEPLKSLEEDAAVGGTALHDRVPCSVAFSRNLRLYKLEQRVSDMEQQKITSPFKHATGNDAKKFDKEEKKAIEAYGFEAGKEAGRWASDPAGMAEKAKVKPSGARINKFVGPSNPFANAGKMTIKTPDGIVRTQHRRTPEHVAANTNYGDVDRQQTMPHLQAILEAGELGR